MSASYIEQLVAQKGEKFKDPEFIAKSKLESDEYIKELERQVNELKEDLPKEEFSKKLLDALTTTKTETPSTQKPSETKPELKDQDIESLIDKALTKKQTEASVKENLMKVQAMLKEAHGTEADAFLAKRAGELGIGVDRLKEIGAESPEAFRSLVGVKKEEAPKMTTTSVKSESLMSQSPETRNFDFYQKLRKTNKRAYYSPAVQQQYFKDRKQLGDKFY